MDGLEHLALIVCFVAALTFYSTIQRLNAERRADIDLIHRLQDQLARANDRLEAKRKRRGTGE